MQTTFITDARMGADPQYRPNQNINKTCISFPIYVNYTENGEKKTEIVHCSAWGNAANSIHKQMDDGRFLKGCRVCVTGEMHMHEYTVNGSTRVSQQISRLDKFSSDVQAGWQENHMNAIQASVPCQDPPQVPDFNVYYEVPDYRAPATNNSKQNNNHTDNCAGGYRQAAKNIPY